MEEVLWVGAAVGVAGLAISLAGVLIARRQLKAFRWNQAQATLELAKMWVSRDLANSRAYLRDRIKIDGPEPLDMDILHAHPDSKRIREELNYTLNFLETVSTAVQRKIIDPETAYHLWVHVVVNAGTVCKPYIDECRVRADHASKASLRTFGHLELLAAEWRAKLVREGSEAEAARAPMVYRLFVRDAMDDGRARPRLRR